MTVIQNKIGSKAVLRTFVTVTANLTDFQAAGETVAGLGISQVYYTGDWTVARGANTVLALHGSDNWEFDGLLELDQDSTGNLTITAGTNPGMLILELRKQFALGTDPEYAGTN